MNEDEFNERYAGWKYATHEEALAEARRVNAEMPIGPNGAVVPIHYKGAFEIVFYDTARWMEEVELI